MIQELERLLVEERNRVALAQVEHETVRPSVRSIKVVNDLHAIHCNCAVEWLHTDEPTMSGKPDLIFGDPPFNIGQAYAGYDDNLEPELHSAVWRGMLLGMHRIAVPRTMIATHVPESMLHMTLSHARDAGFRLWQHVVRSFGFGQWGESRYINGHENLLMFCKTDRPWWNDRKILVESSRRRMKTPDARIKKSKRKGWVVPATVWQFAEKLEGTGDIRPADACWDFARIQGNNKERWKDHPNQLPMRYMARLVLAHSRPGKPVVEVCPGSGPLAMVAMAAGRIYHGCDISELNCKSILQRVKDEQQQELARIAIDDVSAPKRLTLPPGRDWSEV